MKLLYIVPKINNEGGVARVLSVKINYLVEKKNYEVHILTQNDGNSPLFYEFNDKIKLHDISLKGNKISFFFQYKKALQKTIKAVNPDVIIICDNGFKAFLVPFILRTKIPVIFESHGSKYVRETKPKNNFISKSIFNFQLKFKEFAAKKFTKFVALSDENLKEWRVNNGIVISNPLWFSTEKTAELENKKALVLARHSYEKGIDRLLLIWQKVIQKYPDWILEIYGNSNENKEYKKLAISLEIDKNVCFLEPVKNISKKYLEASFYLMTSRSEGFPMVLIEAMAFGLPCVAYDCPTGPKAIIDNENNGFLVENDNEDAFVGAVSSLIENKNLRLEMGEKAQKSVKKFNLEIIMKQWVNLFDSLVKN